MKVTILKVAVAHTALAAALVALPVIDSVARSTPKSAGLVACQPGSDAFASERAQHQPVGSRF